jgi:exodeoxyribonuclease VIII
MRMGTLIHERILEPHKPLRQIAIVPETYQSEDGPKKWTFNAKACQAWRRQQEAEGRLVVTALEMEAIDGCVDSILEDSLFATIFHNGFSEVSVFNRIQTQSGKVLTRARIDWVPDRSINANALVDIKKVGKGNAAKAEFLKLAIDRGYHRQAAGYLENWNAQADAESQRDSFVFVVVEDVAPYLVNVIPMGPRTLALGREEYFTSLETYSQCVKSRSWPGYSRELIPVEAPDWVFRRAA